MYIGLETGSNELLRWLCKPATAERMQRCVRALKEAHIAVGVIVLLGAGGRAFDAAHRRQTAEVLNELSLGAGDYIYFSPLVIYGGRAAFAAGDERPGAGDPRGLALRCRRRTSLRGTLRTRNFCLLG